jgi:hypothetical protein
MKPPRAAWLLAAAIATSLTAASAVMPATAHARAGWRGADATRPRTWAGTAWSRPSPLDALRAAWRPFGSPRTAASSGHAPAAAGPSGPGALPGAISSAPDGAGGTYVAWQDFRDGPSDIYLLRVTNAGAVASGWPTSGLVVCNASGAQILEGLIADGANGVIVAWQDLRNGWVGGEGWAQRVTPAGAVQWAANGIQIGTGFTQLPSIAPDGTGGMLAAWSAGSDIYAKRFDSSGNLATGWTASGTVVCSAVDDQLNPVIVGSGSGGAIVAWEDMREGSGISHVYGQRLNASGAAQWTTDGVQLDAASFANDPAMIPDGSGGAMLCWWESNAFQGLMRGQRIDTNGAPQWTGGTDLSGPLDSGEEVGAATDGLGGMVATWVSTDQLANRTLGAQRVNASGAVSWGSTGAAVTTSSLFQAFGSHDVAADGSGGAYFTWMLGDLATQSTSMRAQRIAPDGSVSWAADGIAVSSGPTVPFDFFVPSIANDGAGGLVIAWPEWDAVFLVTLRAQRYTAAGSPQLGSGATVYADPGRQGGSQTVTDGLGGAWVLWTEKTALGYDVRGRHVTAGGTSTAPTIEVTQIAGDQILVGAVSDGAGGVIAGWRDHRGADNDVYGQRLDASGAPKWGSNGLALCSAAADQWLTSVSSDNAGGALFAWYDYRNATPLDGNVDIFGQQVNAAGAPQWGTNGLPICTDASYQLYPWIVSDAAGGANVVWSDFRGGGDAYLQHVSSVGTPTLTANGVALTSLAAASLSSVASDGAGGTLVMTVHYATDPVTDVVDSTELHVSRFDGTGALQWDAVAYRRATYAEFPIMAGDGSGGAWVAWSDGRGGPFDVYAQRITNTGTASNGLGGVAVCTASGWQWTTSLYVSGAGDATIAWSDERAGLGDVYAQRITSAGSTSWTPNGAHLCGAVRGQYGVSSAADNGQGGLFAWTDYRDGVARYIYTQRVNATGVPQWTAEGVVPVQIALVRAAAAADRVTLEWTLQGGAIATVYRRDSGSGWRAIARTTPDGTGRVRFEDTAVVPGSRYVYRLGTQQSGSEVTGGETWVDVPLAFTLALRGLVPDPATGPVAVALSLASSQPARLEILDVAGRVVVSRDFAGLAPGAHLVALDRGLPRAGVYFLRLTQGTQVAVRRSVFVE